MNNLKWQLYIDNYETPHYFLRECNRVCLVAGYHHDRIYLWRGNHGTITSCNQIKKGKDYI